MTYHDFAKMCFETLPADAMLPDGTDPQKALEILIEHFLGYLPIVNYPCGHDQWNSEAVYEVLRKYPEGKIRRIPKRRRET